MPQHNTPHASPPIGPAASQLSPTPHPAVLPHRQTFASQCSPRPQHAIPHRTPPAQPPLGTHVLAPASLPASLPGGVLPRESHATTNTRIASQRMARS
jgi:hypothetical protein